jgi:uncharacterized phage infection (PIP) family protein YhgE
LTAWPDAVVDDAIRRLPEWAKYALTVLLTSAGMLIAFGRISGVVDRDADRLTRIEAQLNQMTDRANAAITTGMATNAQQTEIISNLADRMTSMERARDNGREAFSLINQRLATMDVNTANLARMVQDMRDDLRRYSVQANQRFTEPP